MTLAEMSLAEKVYRLLKYTHVHKLETLAHVLGRRKCSESKHLPS